MGKARDYPYRKRLWIFSLAAAGLVGMPRAWGEVLTDTWDGTIGDWSSPVDWSLGVTPNNQGAVTYFPVISTGSVTLNGSVTTSGLELDAAGTLTLGTSSNFNLVSNL